MKFTVFDEPEFDKTVRKDSDGYYHCPKCSYESKVQDVFDHFCATHND
jgi:hypothetical protein